jgi:tetratricopeptide (TPR) repeat protein
MFSYRRAAALSLTSTFYLFSVAGLTAQSTTENDKSLAGDQRQRPKQTAARQTPADPKLPFETSVVIYYGVPKKISAAPAAVMPGGSQANRLPERKVINSTESDRQAADRASTFPPMRSRLEVSSPGAAQSLQPVIISYRGYQPQAFSEISEPELQNTKNAAGGNDTPRMKKEAFSAAAQIPMPVAPTRNLAKAIPFLKAGSNVVAGPDSIGTEILQPITQEKPVEPAPPILVSNPAAESEPKAALPSLTKTATEQEPAVAGEPAASGASVTGEISTGSANVPKSLASTATVKENLLPTAPINALPLTASGTSALTIEPAESASVPTPPSAEPPPAAVATRANAVSTVNVVQLNNDAVKETLDANYEDALKHLQQAIEARPNVAKFYRNLSIVYERMKRIDDALAAARTAAQLAPTAPSIIEQLCALEVVAKNAANGITCYERLKQMEPLDVLGQTYYAAALFHSGKLDESVGILEKAVQVTPAFPDSLNLLGVVYYTQKRVADAIAMFKSAVETSPDLCQARYNLGVAELANGNKAAAISQYNMIKSVDPKLAEQLYRGIFSDKLLFVGAETGRH